MLVNIDEQLLSLNKLISEIVQTIFSRERLLIDDAA